MGSKRVVLLLISSSVALVCLCPKSSCSAAVQSQDPQQCVQELVQWCESNSYSQGTSIVSSNVEENGNQMSLYCKVDKEGTMCQKDGSPWFHCYPNKTLQYNGQWLTADSAGDSGTCAARDEALHFQSGSNFDSAAFNKGMERFNQQMRDFQERMKNFGRRFSPMFNFPLWPFVYYRFDDLDRDFYATDNPSDFL